MPPRDLSPAEGSVRAPAPTGPRSQVPLVAALTAVLTGSIVVAVSIGSVAIPVATVWEVIAGRALGREPSADIGRNVTQIVWELRTPRTLLAATVGAGLSIVGVAVQALVRNALADPYVLGASSGASVGAASAILFGAFGSFGSAGISVAAFLASMGAMVLVYAVGQERGRLDPLRLVLAGVVIGSMLAAITSFMVFVVDPRAAQQVLFWLLGSFGRARWEVLTLPVAACAGGLAYLLARSRWLDALQAGDETASTLGVPVGRLRIELFVVTAALTGTMVAVSGAIAFVGLVMPHATRLLIGGRHRRVLPVAALLGASFMVWVDVAARVVVAPQEIPVGVITALVGGPLFLVLLRRPAGRRSHPS